MQETRWHFVRHAPVPNPKHLIYGASDPAADVSDAAAFAALARRLPKRAAWLVTHLRRTRQTADAIAAAGHPCPPFLEDRRLAEQDLGAWVGRSHAELHAEQGEAWHRFWLAPAAERAPDGESFLDVVARVRTAFAEHTEAFVGRDVVCVAHGGSIKAVLSIALGLEPERALSFTIGNLSTTLVDCLHPEPGFAGGYRVRGVNLPPMPDGIG